MIALITRIQVLFVGWTLIFEVYFYLLLAAFLFCRIRFAFLAVAFAITFVAGDLLSNWFDLGAFGYLISSHKLWFFWCGLVVYTLFSRSYAVNRLIFWGSWIALVASLIITPNSSGLGRQIMIASICVSALIIAISYAANGDKPGLLFRCVSRIGDSSYTLYLYHSLVIMVITGFWRRGWADPNSDHAGVVILIMAALLAAFSIPLYRFIEKPITNYQIYILAGSKIGSLWKLGTYHVINRVR